jgi:hypothetical protein
VAPVATIARVLRVSRKPVRDANSTRRASPCEEAVDTAALPDGWQQLGLSTETVTVEEGLHVLARRHLAAGYRNICSGARRAGFVVNRTRHSAQLTSATDH